MIIIQIFLLILFCFLLIKAAEWVIVSLRRISKKTKTNVFVISAFILAIGTSLPELFVGITSAIEKTPSISLGVVLGSNIANIALVTGMVTLIAGKIVVRGTFLKKDVFLALVAGLLPLGLMADGILGKIDGLILLSAYAAYASSFFKDRYQEIANEHLKENFFYKFLREINHIDFDITKEYGRLFISLGVLLFSAQMLINSATKIANFLGIPIFIVGLIAIAIGTSLPELIFSLKSIKDGQPTMFFGNLLGSTIANSTLIIGLTALIHPIVIVSFIDYTNAVVAFVVIFLTFWYFIRSKHRLDRWEGGVLVLLYIIFILVEFLV